MAQFSEDSIFAYTTFHETISISGIGVWELKLDRTPYIEEGTMDDMTPEFIPTYENENVEAFARIWTGFDWRPRGNFTQKSSTNFPRESRLLSTGKQCKNQHFPPKTEKHTYICDF